MGQQDPLQTELLQRELAAKSWANPANRPPRDTSALINRQHKFPDEARAMQRFAIEDVTKVQQPRFNIAPDGGLPTNLDGSLNVVTDPQALINHILEHPEFYQDDIDDLQDNPDEDAEDNADQDPEESLMRQLLNRVQGPNAR